MTVRHIKIFLCVCQNGCNTTKAAQIMHMAQPAVSLAIREMEEYYGVRLFDRIGKRLWITEAGKRFLEYGTRISSLFDDMEKGMRDQDAFGLLRVGASITIGSQFLPGYVKAFYSRFPGTAVKALVAPTDTLEQKLLKNELDFALIEGIVHDPSLISEDYMEDHLTVICPADGTFRHGQQLTVEEFRKQNFLLREPGSGTREVFDRVIEGAGFTVEPVWEAMSTAALVNAVINGLGIAVLPHRMITAPLEQGLVTAVRVEGLEFRRAFRIVYHREKYLTGSARAFLDLCRHHEADRPTPSHHGPERRRTP